MFKKRDADSMESFDTLVGTRTSVEGNIEAEGIIRVDGKVKGDLNISGDVFVGSDARINGNIYANNVHLAGTIEGNIVSKGLLRILATSKLYGDIEVHSFVADEGALFKGKCSMLDSSDSSNRAESAMTKKVPSGKSYRKSSILDEIHEESGKDAGVS